MDSFIKECVNLLYSKYGSDISELKVILPTRRAKLFFNIYLTESLNGKAIWEPEFLSINSIMESISEIKIGEKLSLLITLHKAYSKFHKIEFDEFYNWGDMLIADFDAIDNYLIDTEKLFKNSHDLKELDKLFEDIAIEQKEIISSFWRSFSTERHSKEQKEFLKVWNTLFDIYNLYKKELRLLGIGYKGMIYREAAERLKRTPSLIPKTNKFAVIGFNALSSSEKILFDTIKSHNNSDFLWDYDHYYVDDKHHEAGLFIRENLKRYPDSSKIKKNNYLSEKKINVIDYPSDSMQCKGVWDFLIECHKEAQSKGKTLAKETAIILTNESLLIPVLYSIPQEIDKFNVTSGYPLKSSSAFTLFSFLVKVQRNKKIDDGITKFYYKDIYNIISHPFIKESLEDDAENIIKFYNQEIALGHNFIDTNTINNIELIDLLFSNVTSWKEMSEYIKKCIEIIGKKISLKQTDKSNLEFLYAIYESVLQLSNTINQNQLEITLNTYISSLEKHINSINIAFEGEPLVGIQIMGILETRNLDFENVLILSVNEDSFPSNSVKPSYIPQNLRFGYGLPTVQYHEAMYSYYFYRLIQRAKRVDISYCSMSDGLKNGEPSRFISQLKYAKTHHINFNSISVKTNSAKDIKDSFRKGDLFDIESQKFFNGTRKLSPSSIFDYIQCPAKFHFSKISNIKKEDDIDDQLDAMKFGTIVHKAMEVIYTPLIKTSNNHIIESLSKYKDGNLLDKVITNCIKEELKNNEGDFSGDIISKIEFIKSYLLNMIDYDISRNDGFIIEGIEANLNSDIEIDLNGKKHNIKIYGMADRIDCSQNGIRVISDYKTGEIKQEAKTIESVFDIENPKLNKPFMQALTYCYMYQKEYNKDVVPSLYFAKAMRERNYTHKLLLADRSNKFKIENYNTVKQEFETALKAKVTEIFDKNTDFIKTKNVKVCEYCDYKEICGIN